MTTGPSHPPSSRTMAMGGHLVDTTTTIDAFPLTFGSDDANNCGDARKANVDGNGSVGMGEMEGDELDANIHRWLLGDGSFGNVESHHHQKDTKDGKKKKDENSGNDGAKNGNDDNVHRPPKLNINPPDCELTRRPDPFRGGGPCVSGVVDLAANVNGVSSIDSGPVILPHQFHVQSASQSMTHSMSTSIPLMSTSTGSHRVVSSAKPHYLGTMRLLQFNEWLKTKHRLDLRYWQRCCDEFFNSNAIIKLGLVHGQQPTDTLSYEVVVDAMPRFMLAIHEEGLCEIHLMMENPREFTMTNGQTVVFCTRSVMLFIYQDNTQITCRGTLRASFASNAPPPDHDSPVPYSSALPKLDSLQFQAQSFVELVPKHSSVSTPSPTTKEPIQMTPYGLPLRALRLLQVMDSMRTLKPLMKRGEGPRETLVKFMTDKNASSRTTTMTETTETMDGTDGTGEMSPVTMQE